MRWLGVTEDFFKCSRGIVLILFDHKKYVFDGKQLITDYTFWRICVQLVNNVLNEFVQCIIGYINHDLFVDTKEEPSNKELLNKFGRVILC